jgi:phosphoglycerate dehydrogenase-like enzyme
MQELEALVGEVIYNTTGRPLSSEEVRSLLPGCDGYIAGLDAIDRDALSAADRLQVIARYGVGIDNVDLPAAMEKGIAVTVTPGANSASVAELAVGLILALARRIPEAVTATRMGEWPRLSGLSLVGKTVGLLGIGAIGKQVARRLSGFDCRLLAYDPYPDEDFARQHGVDLLPHDELLSRSDFLSLHLPLLPETRGLVNTAFIKKMKPGAFLINTSRGELIDEPALVYAVKNKWLRGAALDVFAHEPPGADNPLLHMPEVIVTPHCASHTDGATNAMGWMALNDCLAVLRGETPKYPVT